jgi:hypothetical protein
VPSKESPKVPGLAPLLEPLVRVLDPDDRDTFVARPLDQGVDIGDDLVTMVGTTHDAVLDVDHHQGRVGSIRQRGHGDAPPRFAALGCRDKRGRAYLKNM